MNGIGKGLIAGAGSLYFALLGLWKFFAGAVLPLLGIALAVLLMLLAVAVIRTLAVGSKKSTYAPDPDPAREREYAEKLSAMVQCETVSARDVSDPEKFRAFHKVLEQLYPTVFAACEKIDLDGNLLMRWP